MRVARRVTTPLLISIMLLAVLSGPAMAQDSSDIKVTSPIRALELAPGQSRVDLDLDLDNNTENAIAVKAAISGIPEGWDIAVWNRIFQYRITEIIVEPTEEGSFGERPRIRVNIPEDPPVVPGEYTFSVVVSSPDDATEYMRGTYRITVPVQPPPAEQFIEVRTDFPVQSGPTSADYQFEVVVINNTLKERSFALAGEVRATTPDGPIQSGWQLSFAPAFGDEKLISSVSIPPAQNERIDVILSPSFFTATGEYFVPIRASSDEFEAETLLGILLVGRGEVTISTPSGLLSVDATAGELTESQLRLANIGTGDLAGIGLLADSPPDWEVTFQLDTVDSLPENNIIDIGVSITAPDDAIPGDYNLTLRARTGDTADAVDLRVTVEQSTIWGWLGIVLVLVVLGGLGGVFWRLGRR
jgi:uncharacterized membrane protein